MCAIASSVSLSLVSPLKYCDFGDCHREVLGGTATLSSVISPSCLRPRVCDAFVVDDTENTKRRPSALAEK